MYRSPMGLSPFAVDGQNIILAETIQDWIIKILSITKNQSERERLGKEGRAMVEKFHNIQNSYNTFVKIVFNNNENVS